ncbi:MAG: methyl-accepting chemotaxis protein [Phycisphaerales bacterium]|jgi:methyl-accepting chemotaxis protein|nr:methyl-accepting chemotaxis protein [Phycisphaerales bacterium]
MKIRIKLVLGFLAVGVLPAVGVGVINWFATEDVGNMLGDEMLAISANVINKIDRSLYERYGDVQAFALNSTARNQDNWYKGPAQSAITKAMDEYIKLYGIYSLSLVVDPQGKVVAVNSISPQGKPLDTAFIMNQSFAGAGWLHDALNGRFLTNGSLTGTVVEDAHVDPLVQKVYGNEGLVLGFSAPIKNDKGEIVAVWKNFADFALAEEVIFDSYQKTAKRTSDAVEFTLMDAKGNVIVDCDPSIHGGKLMRDMNVIGKLNLADKGVEAAKEAVAGKTGFLFATHARKNVLQACGYTHSAGALGFPGLGWHIMVRAPREVAMQKPNAIRAEVAMVVGVSALAVLGFGLFLASRITKPINSLGARMKDIAEGEGDLTQRVPASGNDEIATLSSSFNTFVDKIHATIKQVATTTNELAAAATQIAASAEEMASGITRQEQQTSQVSAAVVEMSASVGEVAQKAKDVNLASDAARDNASKGGNIVQQTVSEIMGIAEDVGQSAESVTELGKQSEQIGEIIQVINEIAEQTNLLALNAAIEAARAGEHGRGFAVVADEVRKLAERTTQATDEVAKSIKAIQGQTGTAVQQIEAGSSRVNKGVDLATNAGTALKSIVEGSARLSEMVAAIAAAAEQQSAASEQITRSVEQISSVTRETSQGASQSAQAAAGLSEQAERLRSLVGAFKI